MDAKSLARSKRAHSLHHSKKPHSNPKSRPSGDRSTVAGKKAGEKPVGDTPRNSLLSNWDRYEEEFDPDGGELPGNSSRQLSEVPLPKSRGGDYRQLIDEAKSQPFSPLDPFLDTFPTVADLFPEFFSRGEGSLLSAQADRILQSVNDESFIVEDKGAPNYEAPLLSLNLNALAEQLSKIDVAKRLFIEPDLLPPPEQQVEATSTVSSKNTIAEVQKGKSEAALKQLSNFNFDEFDFIKEEKAKKDKNHISEATVESGKQATSSSTFKAATAEAELDALLNSFGETKLHDIDIPIEDTSAQVLLRPGPGPSEPSLAPPPPSAVNIDVLLDDLLEETSKIGNGKGPLVSDRAGSSAPANSRSNLLNDFDSWLDTI